MHPQHWLRMISSRFRSLFRRQANLDLNEELLDHLEQKTQLYIQRGLQPQQARRQALIDLGGMDQAKERCRDTRGVNWIEHLLQDLRFALRMLRKSPSFTAVAILTLALGLGASTAVFSIVNTVLLKPLPYPNPERILYLRHLPAPGLTFGWDEFPWSPVDVQAFQTQSKAFDAIGAFRPCSFNLTDSGKPVTLHGIQATAGFFPALGTPPFLGRFFSAAEDAPGHNLVAVLGNKTWKQQFASDPRILGRSIKLNNASYAVIGVMPPDFAFPRADELPGGIFTFAPEPDLWVPLALPPNARGLSDMAVIGRLKAGVTFAQAQADANLISASLGAQRPAYKGWFRYSVRPLVREIAGGTRQPLLLVLLAVSAVLLIACANVASLLLARSLGRQREFTLRTALGAPRRRLVRQLLTESITLALIGGVLGLALAELAIRLLLAFGPSDIPRLQGVSLDAGVFAFALAISLATGILFGLAPALGAVRPNLVQLLVEGGERSAGSRGSKKLRKALVVSEVALALVLTIASGLLVRTFASMLRVNPGFDSAGVVTFELNLSRTKYPDISHVAALYSNVLQSLQSLPAIQTAALTESVPMGAAPDGTVLKLIGQPAATGPGQNAQPFAGYSIVSPGYFSVMRVPLLRGRDFASSDTQATLPVAVVNEAMANAYWSGGDALGKQVGFGTPSVPAVTIVGVVGNVKQSSLREDPAPAMFVDYQQRPWSPMWTMQVVLRPKADTASVLGSVRSAISSVDSELPISKITTLQSLLHASMVEPRFAVALLGSFALLALALAAVGMYGLISYSVAQQIREIGIRLALGATPAIILRSILTMGIRLASFGIVIGLVLSFSLTTLTKSFLYGVTATDPVTYVLVSVLLVAVALLACYIPARRAMRVDPLVALRYE